MKHQEAMNFRFCKYMQHVFNSEAPIFRSSAYLNTVTLYSVTARSGSEPRTGLYSEKSFSKPVGRPRTRWINYTLMSFGWNHLRLHSSEW